MRKRGKGGGDRFFVRPVRRGGARGLQLGARAGVGAVCVVVQRSAMFFARSSSSSFSAASRRCFSLVRASVAAARRRSFSSARWSAASRPPFFRGGGLGGGKVLFRCTNHSPRCFEKGGKRRDGDRRQFLSLLSTKTEPHCICECEGSHVVRVAKKTR